MRGRFGNQTSVDLSTNPSKCKGLKMKMCKTDVVALTITLIALPVWVTAGQHSHEIDMKQLPEFCKTLTNDKCHELHAKNHMRHHGGTRENFQKHYEDMHGKVRGETQKKSH